MKQAWRVKIAGLLLFAAGLSVTYDVSAQANYIGVRGGYGGGNIKLIPFAETGMAFGQPLFGISFKHYGRTEYFDAIQAEVNYVGSMYKTFARAKSDSTYTRTIYEFEVPIMWQPHYEFMDGRARVFLNAGPYISYAVSSKYEYKDRRDPSSDYNRKGTYHYNTMKDNRLGYGVIGGGGVSFLIRRRIEIQAEVRYRFGFGDIYKGSNKYDYTPTRQELVEMGMSGNEKPFQSQMGQIRASLAVYYRFGKRDKNPQE